MRCWLYIILWNTFFTLAGQEITIHGEITDNENKPIPGATVVISSKEENKVLSYAITNYEGKYTIGVLHPGDVVGIEISHLGYIKIKDNIQLSTSSLMYNAVLKEKTVDLEQVIVKAQKIRDTMRLATDSLLLNQRSTLRDILDQTEGFMVSDDGAISFRGKQINKILINKKEVFVNQNKTALDNLSYDIMEDIQLINNYRDKFDIDFDNFTESVLNVDTKKEFKGVLKAFGDGAFGIKDKYLAKVRGFYFSDVLNAFVTSNTNNVGEKEFGFNDVANAFKERSSAFFKNRVTPFFNEDHLAKSAFDSNTGITLRKEGDTYRIGVVAHYNNTAQTKVTSLITTTAQGNDPVKTEDRSRKHNGDLLTANLRLNYVLGQKTILNLIHDLGYVKSRSHAQKNIQNFIPQANTIDESRKNNPSALIVANHLNLKSMLSSKAKLHTGVANHYESSENRFLSEYVVLERATLSQKYNFRKRHYKGYADLELKHNDFISTTAGTEIGLFNEKNTESIQGDQRRKGQKWEPYLQFRGQKKAWQYYVRIAPQFYNFYSAGAIHDRKRPKIGASLHYAPSGNSQVWVSYTQKNRLPDIYNDLDTLNLSFNERLLKERSINNTVSGTNSLEAGYHYSNIAKSQSFRVSYSRNVDYDYLEPVFDTIKNNVFYYKNFLIDKKQGNGVTVAASKGFYFSEKYHKVTFSARGTGDFSKFPTMVGAETVNYKKETYRYRGAVSLEPRKFIIDRFRINTAWNTYKLALENENINTQKTYSLTANVSKKADKLEIDLTGGYHLIKNQEVDFTYPILQLNATVKLNNTLEVFVKGRNLFHLFKTANTTYTGLNIISEGNFINKNINRYNINYLIFGLSYKP